MNTDTEFKKTDPWDYNAPEHQAQILELKPRLFATLSGAGDPNGPEFAAALGALYSLCYAVRMSYKAPNAPAGAYSYTVGALQGRWDLLDPTRPYNVETKDNLKWTVMIRQPEFLTPALFETFVQTSLDKATKKKEPSVPWFEKLKLERSYGGTFAQILHRGSYDSEPQTFLELEELLKPQGYVRTSKIHYEIYLSDPRKTQTDKLRTLLRIPVQKEVQKESSLVTGHHLAQEEKNGK